MNIPPELAAQVDEAVSHYPNPERIPDEEALHAKLSPADFAGRKGARPQGAPAQRRPAAAAPLPGALRLDFRRGDRLDRPAPRAAADQYPRAGHVLPDVSPRAGGRAAHPRLPHALLRHGRLATRCATPSRKRPASISRRGRQSLDAATRRRSRALPFARRKTDARACTTPGTATRSPSARMASTPSSLWNVSPPAARRRWRWWTISSRKTSALRRRPNCSSLQTSDAVTPRVLPPHPREKRLVFKNIDREGWTNDIEMLPARGRLRRPEKGLHDEAGGDRRRGKEERSARPRRRRLSVRREVGLHQAGRTEADLPDLQCG